MPRPPKLILLLLLTLFGACGNGSSTEIDDRLVGRWQYSRGNSLLTTSITCDLKTDGTYTYTGYSISRHLNTNPVGSTATGKWKVKGDHLHILQDGTSEWLDIGRFSISGNGLVLYAANGRTTYWER